ncbi:hypothetical protein BVRB_9g205080 [Beta vulgaris subsp. vulgaris]|nr:hypothetical protein BVRB_9g205080 [Beta vulgaris subsp. vulgaris]
MVLPYCCSCSLVDGGRRATVVVVGNAVAGKFSPLLFLFAAAVVVFPLPTSPPMCVGGLQSTKVTNDPFVLLLLLVVVVAVALLILRCC